MTTQTAIPAITDHFENATNRHTTIFDLITEGTMGRGSFPHDIIMEEASENYPSDTETMDLFV